MRSINRISAVAVVAAVVLILTSCATTGAAAVQSAPGWVLNPSDGYPDAQYMTAVGYASSRQTAESNAVAALTKIIRQDVETSTVATESVSGRDEAWERARSIDTYVQTSSNLTVTGIVIQDVFVTSEQVPTYYALALIDRKEVGQIYLNRAKETSQVIMDKIAIAQDEKGPLSAYRIMKEAAAAAAENDDTLDMLAVINKDMWKSYTAPYRNAAAVEELARQALDRASVYVVVTGDESGRIATAFSAKIQDMGLKTVEADSADTAGLVLTVNVSLEQIDMDSSANNKFIRFVLTGSLVETVTGKEMEKYGTSGREAHVTVAEAKQRAIRTLEKYVNELSLLTDLQ